MKSVIEFALDSYRTLFEHTDNPLYAWHAIQDCIKEKEEFPDWVLAYLLECAERVQTDKAKQTTDVRAVLPWIFGFVRNGKPGPGKLLDPDNDPDGKKMRFGFRFAGRVMRGEQPSEARANAYNDVFSEGAPDIDDKTLHNWLLKEFNLKDAPSTAEEWNKVCAERAHNFIRYVLNYAKE
jgi:succinate dehydrogenase flavin-adding protein (antitoxin of CptAB toxin-antitoxin module)